MPGDENYVHGRLDVVERMDDIVHVLSRKTGSIDLDGVFGRMLRLRPPEDVQKRSGRVDTLILVVCQLSQDKKQYSQTEPQAFLPPLQFHSYPSPYKCAIVETSNVFTTTQVLILFALVTGVATHTTVTASFSPRITLPALPEVHTINSVYPRTNTL